MFEADSGNKDKDEGLDSADIDSSDDLEQRNEDGRVITNLIQVLI